MKTKLMFAALAAAAVFTACNKEPNPVQNDQIGTKSIAINVANVLPGVKSVGETIADETQVQLNSYQVFFVGGNKLYTPMDLTAQNVADTYFDDTEVADLDRQFHFLPKAVTEVIVVGNMSEIAVGDGENEINTRTELMNKINNGEAGITIASQKEPTELLLIGSDDTLVAMNPNGTHETAGEDEHPDPLVRADVNLKPVVARFEITGFEYAQVPATGDQAAPAREYASIAVNNVSMVKFYETAKVDDNLANVTTTGSIYNDQLFTLNDIYSGYFNSVDRTQWYFDAIDNLNTEADESHILDSTTSYKWGVNDTDVTSSGKTCYYYHTFPNVVPSFVVGLTGTYTETIGENENTLATPLYLQTTALMNGTQQITKTEAGKIYRMYFKFDDTNIKDAEKCIAVYVTVLNWDVVITTPVFGNN